MGCLYSKTVRCSRCNRSVDADDFVLSNNICQTCIQVQQVGEYRRRLAALRDDGTTATSAVRSSDHPSVASGWSGLSIQSSQRAGVSERRCVAKTVPRDTTQFRTPTKTAGKSPARPKPLYGEYKCPQCRHFWSSRRCWANMYQKCQQCGTHVYPHLQRELRKTDMTKTENPHPEHLCEKCIRLGYYCGNFGRSNTNRRT